MSAVPKEKGFNFNLLDQLVFYGSYHNNPLNQLIHFIFVPCIWTSAAVWLCYTGELSPNPIASILPYGLGQYFVINGAFIGFAGYALYYISLAPLIGLTYDFVLFALYLCVNYIYQTYGPSQAWLYALGLHVLGWYMQIYPGHIVFEKRRAALFDSFFQSLVLAPLFTWFELVFFLGLMPEFKQQVQDRVGKNILEFRRYQKAAKTK